MAAALVVGAEEVFDGTTFVDDPTADDDDDGLNALAEYFFGTSDNDPNSPRPWQAGVSDIDGSDFLTLSYTASTAALDVDSVVEISDDLATWRSGAGEVELVSETPNLDGTTTYMFRSSTPVPPTLRQFMRIRLTLIE